MPIIRSSTTAVATSGIIFGVTADDSSAVGHGRAGQATIKQTRMFIPEYKLGEVPLS